MALRKDIKKENRKKIFNEKYLIIEFEVLWQKFSVLLMSIKKKFNLNFIKEKLALSFSYFVFKTLLTQDTCRK